MHDANSPFSVERGCNGHGTLRSGPSESGIQPRRAGFHQRYLSLSKEGSHFWMAFSYIVL